MLDIRNSKEIAHEYSSGDAESEKRWVDFKEIMVWIETNLIMPFEGELLTDNEREKEIHRKITNYNREKFNKLCGEN